MNQKQRVNTFMVISNWKVKQPFGLHKKFSVSQGLNLIVLQYNITYTGP